MKISEFENFVKTCKEEGGIKEEEADIVLQDLKENNVIKLLELWGIFNILGGVTLGGSVFMTAILSVTKQEYIVPSFIGIMTVSSILRNLIYRRISPETKNRNRNAHLSMIPFWVGEQIPLIEILAEHKIIIKNFYTYLSVKKKYKKIIDEPSSSEDSEELMKLVLKKRRVVEQKYNNLLNIRKKTLHIIDSVKSLTENFKK